MLSRSFCYGNGEAAENAYAALALLDNRQLLFTFFLCLKNNKYIEKCCIYYDLMESRCEMAKQILNLDK